MSKKRYPAERNVILAAFFCALALSPAGAQNPGSMALTGQVTSQEEGPMEGVLVSAKAARTNITITVVSDEKGRYSFPRARLKPGQYALIVKAAGYEIASPRAVTGVPSRAAQLDPDQHTAPMSVPAGVAANRTAQLDLKLTKAPDLASQLSKADWLISFPGSLEQKRLAMGCGDCHSLERVAKSKYDAAAFLDVIKRMRTYTNGSGPSRPIKRVEVNDGVGSGPREPERPEAAQELAQYLSTLNLSSVSHWKYPLWTLPRPRGEATRVVYTEYDLPRPETQPHDAIPDSDGMVWYSDFSSLYLGMLNPRTGEVKEWRIPEVKPGVTPAGSLSLSFDKEGNVWVGSLFQGAIYRFDKKTETFNSWSAPREYNNSQVRTSMVAPQNSHVDGKVWFSNNLANKRIHRLDLATGQIETFDPYGESRREHSVYCIASDPMNNLIFCDYVGSGIGEINAKTGKISRYPTPSPGAWPRRGSLDSQGRFWFGESAVNRIGMFDTKTKEFLEWRMVNPWTDPYDAMLDRNGDVWTGGMVTDRVIRLTPSTEIQFTTALGKRVEYLLPRPTQIRRVFVDSSATPVAFWAGSNLGASIVKLEPLE